MGNKYLQIIRYVNYILFVVAACMLSFPTRVSLYAWGLWLLTWFMEGRFVNKNNLQWNKGLIPLCLLLLWVLCEAVSYVWSIDREDTLNMLIRHLSFILIMPIALWGVNEHYNWRRIAHCFVLTTIISVFVYGIYIYFVWHWDYICMYHSLPEHVRSWTYYANQISLLKHRFYYGTILNLAVIVLFKSRDFALSFNSDNRKNTFFFFVKLVLLTMGVVMSGSRANLITLLVIVCVALLQPMKGKTRAWLASMVAVVSIFFLVLMFNFHPRFEQLHWKGTSVQEFKPTYVVEPRINIWYMALQNPQDYLLHGVGAGANSEYLKPIYYAFHMDEFAKRDYNAHSQYLATCIDMGVLIAFFFTLIWLLYPLFYKGKCRQLATLVALLIALNMLTENMLARIDGVITTCFALLVITLLSRHSPNQKIQA